MTTRKKVTILVLMHVSSPLPKVLQEWAAENDVFLLLSRPFCGDAIPHTSEFDWLIILGGPQNICNQKTDFFIREIEATKKAIILHKWVLGICLGAQVIGEALGAKIERSPEKEIGVFPVTLSRLGKKHPMLKHLSPLFKAMHWHEHMPGLTTDAKVLATSDGCPRQIIQYTESTYGFQCHLELDLSEIRTMTAQISPENITGKYIMDQKKTTYPEL